MDILIANPNSTRSMTDKILASTQTVASAGTRLHARNPDDSPASIEGHYDEVASLPGLTRLIQEGETAGMDAYVVACFSDPGLSACRELATGPVIGICEAAMHAAAMLAGSFSIVTTLPRSIRGLEVLVSRYGMDGKCRRVRAAGIPVLALEEDGGGARDLVLKEVLAAVQEDSCDAVILGCAGMADLTRWLSAEAGVPVIDGCVAAVKFAEALVGAGLSTSKAGTYSWPRPKERPALWIPE